MTPTSSNTASTPTVSSSGRLPPSRTDGFTLLELLVAVVILAAVVAAALGAFNGILGTIGAVESSRDTYAMGRACLNRIMADLESIHVTTAPLFLKPDLRDRPDPYRMEAARKTVGSETFSWIRFSSLAHVDLDGSGRAGIAQIVYYVTQDEDGNYRLHRQDRPYPWPEFEPDSSDPLIAENISGFDLVLYDDKGDPHEQWDSESGDYDWATAGSISVSLGIRAHGGTVDFITRVVLPVVRPPWKKK